jgi:flagellar basal body-associated protein FliL
MKPTAHVQMPGKPKLLGNPPRRFEAKSRLRVTVLMGSPGCRVRRWLLALIVSAGLSLPAIPASAAGEESPEGTPGPAVSGPTFVKLPLFNIPVIEGNKVTRQISVGIALELVEGLKADSIAEKKPAVIDAFLRDLYAMFAQRSGTSRVAVEGSIKQRLAQTADRVLGQGVVRQVLILELVERQR